MSRVALEPKPKEEVEQKPKVSDASIVEKQKARIQTRFTDRVELNCKPHHLWANYFRVNLHDPEKQNMIVESYFVTCLDNDLVLLKEEYAKPSEF
jgi:REP element-mobilizing transposase RayT